MNPPVRAWRLTMDLLDVINEDVAQFNALNTEARQWCAERDTIPVFGIAPPYTMVLAGFAVPIEGTKWSDENARYEADVDTEYGKFLAGKMAQFRAESKVFEALELADIINVNMPQNTLVVEPLFSDLPILITYGFVPGFEPGFNTEGLVEMSQEETRLLVQRLQASDDKEKSDARQRETGN